MEELNLYARLILNPEERHLTYTMPRGRVDLLRPCMHGQQSWMEWLSDRFKTDYWEPMIGKI